MIIQAALSFKLGADVFLMMNAIQIA